MGNDRKFRDRSLNTLWSRDLRNYHKREARKRSQTLEEYLKEKEEVENQMSKKENQTELEATEIIAIKDIAPSDFELPKLDEIKGKEIIIVGFYIDVSQYGEYVVINTLKKGNFITTSKFVIKQLKRVAKNLTEQEKALSEKVSLKAKVSEKKETEATYYILE